MALTATAGQATADSPQFGGALDDWGAQTVRTETLAGPCGRLGFAPNRIKCDVDGLEWDIFVGAGEFLRANQCRLHLKLHRTDLARLVHSTDELRTRLAATHTVSQAVPSDYRHAAGAARTCASRSTRSPSPTRGSPRLTSASC